VVASTEVSGDQILLVDDNPINLQILYKTLQGSGYKLLIAKNGETALEIARTAKPSLVLLDVMMPGLDGFEVCQRLKATPETADITVIFLSALGDSQAKVRGFAVGGVDYIAKPFQSDEVVARVRTHIKIHRLESELARRNSELEEENQQILNAIDEGIIGLDRDGRVTVLNPAATVITGWPAGDVIGERLYGLHLLQGERGSDSEEQTLPYRAYRLGQTVHSDLELIRRRNGELLPVAINCSARKEGGAVLVLRDISEWLEHEEALRQTREELESQRQHMAHMERLSTSGEMAAGIAHEVNQPLTAVVNYARVGRRMLDRDELDREKLAELLTKLDTQAVRASEVIQRLRSYVKKPDIGRRRTDINQLLHEVIALAEVDSRISDVAIHFEFDAALPAVGVDAVQIQQVALNLIRNAMEAMADSPNKHHGVVVQTALDGKWVCFQVIDRGHGLSEAAEKQLFHPFFTTKPNGMGIGLSICQSIVQAHGGEIAYRRNPEGGVIFACRLPATED
jgi:two-component system, LuxR family, sensor kinase FixL